MQKTGWLGLIIFLFMLAQTVLARELTPIEKALRALGQKEKQSYQAVGTTPTAQAQFCLPDCLSGNTQTAFSAQIIDAGTNSVTVTHAGISSSGNTENAQMVLPGGIYPSQETALDTAGETSDAFGLTASATAEIITLFWSNTGTAYQDFAGYLICKAEIGQKMFPLNNTPQAFVTYQDATVTAKTQYIYQVSALDAKGATLVASRPVLVSLLPSLLPNIPQELKATTQEERVLLKWKKAVKTSHDIGGYLVFRSLPPKENWTCLTRIPVTKEEYYDETGVPGVQYNYQVVTVDTRGHTSAASASVVGLARPRSRNGLILMSTAYRGMGLANTGFTGDLQFTYYIGTLYGEQNEELSPLPLYLDPISLWLLSADIKYTFLTESQLPLAVAAGAKGSILLFAGQQSTSAGSFTFSEKSELDYVWGGYMSLSRSFGDYGIHGGYLLGSVGDPIFYLSKYMRYGETERTRNLFYIGMDFPIVHRMNAAWEILYPLDTALISKQHPILLNFHIDRLFNFDISYLHWDQGWAFLGYFNIRFTLYPGAWNN